MNNIKWDIEDMIAHLDEFNDLYESRPIKDNNGGMKSGHMFPAWYVVKKMAPQVLIESGVWRGLGTWFFERASPNSQIISIDPEPRFRIYTSDKVVYLTQDFSTMDWTAIPKENSLVFLDDHQNFLSRLKLCKSLGFNNIMVEDNYPYQQGDCYSPKKILANVDYVLDKAGDRTWHKKSDSDYQYFKTTVTTYQEMPPIFKAEKNRWGDLWDDAYPTPPPLLNNDSATKYPLFFSEKLDYTWLCYIGLGA